jgi:stage II sporulation protein D
VVRGESIYVERFDGKRWRKVVDKIRSVGFSPDPSGVRLDGTDQTSTTFRVRPHYGMVRYKGKYQRGHLIISGSGSRLTTVVVMPLESYLIGVVNGEVDSAWPMEAVRAQVVAARSYALFRMSTSAPLYDVKADTSDQVYAGVDSEDERAAEAVRSTRGQALYRDNGIVPAFFHSSCGGRTSSAADIWGMPHPSLVSVECGLCSDSPRFRWELSLATGEVVGAIRSLFPSARAIRSFGIHRRTEDGRVLILFIETGEGRTLVDAGDFRKVIGYQKLLSTRFSLAVSGDRVIFRGAGYGHGVGLCQWGARGGALRGMTYRQILAKYYLGAEIKRAY